MPQESIDPNPPRSDTALVLKWLKMIIAVLMLPVCAGAAWALWKVLNASGTADTFWMTFLSGAGCWLVIYILLPKPMWMYVFGHEFTHALWTWAMGGRVKKFKASSKGGHVIVTRNNFLIALAPYFFPFYAVLVLAIFAAGNAIWGWNRFVPFFHLVLGAAYSFHVTLTWHILKCHQSDIAEQGYLFSFVVIFLGNALVLLIGIPLLASQMEVRTAFAWWSDCTMAVLAQFITFFAESRR